MVSVHKLLYIFALNCIATCPFCIVFCKEIIGKLLPSVYIYVCVTGKGALIVKHFLLQTLLCGPYNPLFELIFEYYSCQMQEIPMQLIFYTSGIL